MIVWNWDDIVVFGGGWWLLLIAVAIFLVSAIVGWFIGYRVGFRHGRGYPGIPEREDVWGNR